MKIPPFKWVAILKGVLMYYQVDSTSAHGRITRWLSHFYWRDEGIVYAPGQLGGFFTLEMFG